MSPRERFPARQATTTSGKRLSVSLYPPAARILGFQGQVLRAPTAVALVVFFGWQALSWSNKQQGEGRASMGIVNSEDFSTSSVTFGL
ncbi:unnamed protein product [Closterium sp. Yama58-4]|nr:unnamed protein product [Closterium sp. Yama58-4]